MEEETLRRITDYRQKNNISTQSKAIIQLVEIALDDLQKKGMLKRTPPRDAEADGIARAYSKLDRWGQGLVRDVIGHEQARMADETRFLADTAQPEEEPRVIPLFWSAPAAGIAAPIFGEDFDNYELKAGDPQGAMFAVKVGGDSMEPWFPNGSIAFCNKDPLRDGDIGVFAINGDSVIKQYHYDPVLGMTYLFSLNRERRDADVLITRSSGQTLTCLGRVITKRHFPVPGL